MFNVIAARHLSHKNTNNIYTNKINRNQTSFGLIEKSFVDSR